uniref:Glycoprotein-N-acetylgalactosamine 3-beta-galactosyltransferase 1-A n=1 Tax=Anthurium amnicola TaxID=1678845 RepID=A0A1D1Y499_9ARAE
MSTGFATAGANHLNHPEMEGFIERHGVRISKALGVTGIALYVSFVLISNHPCCRSSWSFLMPDRHRPSPSPDHGSSTPTNIHHIAFGIAGSVNTWSYRGAYVDLWWRPNQTRGFVWLDRAPIEYPWPATSPPFRVSEGTGRFRGYDRHKMPFAVRMTRVVLESYRAGMDGVRWFVMADDDTVLFLDNLVEVLRKYDHTAYFYVGGRSECVSQNAQHSFGMAFGGAGYAMSSPLVRELARILDGCLTRYPDLYGSDHVLQSCLAELGVSLTTEPGFHQIDLRGDISGLLSAHPHAPLLSLHHLDYVEPIFPSMTRQESVRHLMVAAAVDSSRLLQQAVCYDRRANWSLSASWGYSVQLYEKIYPPHLLHIPIQTFLPWKNTARPPFLFNVRPASRHPCEAPHVFFFHSLAAVGRGYIVTDYLRRTPRDLPACGNHSADGVSAVRIFSPASRFKWGRGGSRRECCEVLPSSANHVTEIRIRTCRENETME